jgi:hypothetical protein
MLERLIWRDNGTSLYPSDSSLNGSRLHPDIASIWGMNTYGLCHSSVHVITNMLIKRKVVLEWIQWVNIWILIGEVVCVQDRMFGGCTSRNYTKCTKALCCVVMNGTLRMGAEVRVGGGCGVV